MLCTIDESAPLIYQAALSMDPSLVQPSIDHDAVTMDGHVL